ncbi:MAG: UDP-N-acetylmuramoyl-L-alanyl-D-glutamate--2,6-diaminopimelate ligase [Bifidobacteriaceae bacterium]|jgi:UDP-N-acetylmuramoyl-L-alanyl-D-glutamate--2,6-diaminopimelate ligase|nr:UDP-N-acetylmuramoyl-L-alanyl-D-glutamate--2,6-diaminopimelate ligase [Bifidobacteriaceae bacterium]
MKLTDLIKPFIDELTINIDSSIMSINIKGVTTYSPNAKSGWLFLCIKGSKTDRHKYIADAAKRGAVAAIIDNPKYKNSAIPTVLVKNVNSVYDSIIAKFYGNPEKEILLAAITGTDGKTTTCAMIQQLLDKKIGSGKIANFGTNGAIFASQKIHLENTTPDSEIFYPLLREFVQKGAKIAILEFSSEAQHYNRLKNLEFDIIALTSITSDHLNTHKTLKNYINAKYNIFKNHLKNKGAAILNSSDENYQSFKQKIAKNKPAAQIITYGYKSKDNWQIKKIHQNNANLEINYKTENQEFVVDLNILGRYNGYNYICAAAAASQIEKIIQNKNLNNIKYFESKKAKKTTISKNTSASKTSISKEDNLINFLTFNFQIPGRVNLFNTSKKYSVLIDYAHTFEAIKQLIQTVKLLPHQKIIVITGMAGSRDKTKRKKIGTLLEKEADQIILTQDDPHFENNQIIIKDILQGVKNKDKTLIIENRAQAIEKSLDLANIGDIILILGKGDDDYIIQNNKKIPFNDIKYLKSIFSKAGITYTSEF